MHTQSLITVRNSSCGKVIFSEACVKSSVHGGMRGRGVGVSVTGGQNSWHTLVKKLPWRKFDADGN